MKVNVVYKDKSITDNDKKLYVDFLKFLQKEYPLKNDLTITFFSERTGNMSTGSHNEHKREIKILSKGRLNRDTLRTLAHEWVHDYQRNILKRPKGPNIGGKNEDEANAFAGQLIKKFEKQFPKKEKMMYEGLNRKVNLLKEEILLTEIKTQKKELLTEMKKIGIEKLPYSYSALNKFVGSETMNIHYNKHYKGYVKKLNKALSVVDFKYEDLEDIVKSISKFDKTIRNNAGGAFNHALFWKMLSPKKQLPKGEILDKIKKDFGNIQKMKNEFNQVAKDSFGSGWVWLVLTKSNKLKIMSTPNQDNPIMNVIDNGGYPLLGLDLWEHAYYLKFKNKRDNYIKNFWNHINWDFVNDLFVSKSKKKLSESIAKLIVENEEIDQDLKKAMSRELQKIRLIPLDAEAAAEAINNIISAEIERGTINFNRTLQELMSLDLNNVSERSKYRFNNYFQRFVKSKTRGFDFEGMVTGFLDGTLATNLSSPFDVLTKNGDKLSCKIIRDTGERISLKSIRKSVGIFVSRYNGSQENKNKLIELSQYPNFLELLINHENQDLKNQAEDLLNFLLNDITGLLVGVPNAKNMSVDLYYYDKNRIIELIKTPNLLKSGRTKEAQTISLSTKILKMDKTMVGAIKFPMVTMDQYKEFLIGDEKTKEVVTLFNSLGEKYGVPRLGDNIPQDIIRDLSKNERFKFDLKRLTISRA
jgi:Fe-Mn family superoxide dismutase